MPDRLVIIDGEQKDELFIAIYIERSCHQIMSLLGNILWFLMGGLISGLGWVLSGCLWCITIIGIPVDFSASSLRLSDFSPSERKCSTAAGPIPFC